MSPGTDRTPTLRGAMCGAVAAAAWALAQPVDKLLLSSRFDDVELLGRALTRGDGWYPLGFAAHLGNGALFGALYSRLAPSVPLPPAARGPFLALVEHLLTWPLVPVIDRVHPARDQLPALSGNRSAFLQATWRHLLFGLVLGELDRRLGRRPEPPPTPPRVDYSSNGHGSLEQAVSAR